MFPSFKAAGAGTTVSGVAEGAGCVDLERDVAAGDERGSEFRVECEGVTEMINVVFRRGGEEGG